MTDLLAILPLTIVMIGGPQIISAVFLATSVNPGRNSLAYVTGAAISITFMVTLAYVIARQVTGSTESGGGGSASTAISIAILILLVVGMVHVFVRRKTAQPPSWMGRLQQASERLSFRLGLLLLGIFPTDIITSLTVGAKLANDGEPWWHCVPFILLTLLLLATPVLLVVMFGQRAREFLPKVRNWMNEKSWIVSEIVLVFFIVIVASGI